VKQKTLCNKDGVKLGFTLSPKPPSNCDQSGEVFGFSQTVFCSVKP
jgi:hypothetical protein